MIDYNWSDIAFGSKSEVNKLDAVFVAAPREISAARFKSLLKDYLPMGNLLLGIAEEPYVLELDGQPQFKMLQLETVLPIIKTVNARSPNKVYVLNYAQRDLVHVLNGLKLRQAIFVNGSWYRTFHFRPEFFALSKKSLPYDLVSPFANEAEAKSFAKSIKFKPNTLNKILTSEQMMLTSLDVAKQSFDYGGYQTGASLGTKVSKGYRLLAGVHNQIVPYETYAMHHGSVRESNFAGMQDMNHYDTVHAEVCLILLANEQKINLAGASLYVNVMPCPACARMLALSKISEVVYSLDHSDGYAVKMLESAGKNVRRLVV